MAFVGPNVRGAVPHWQNKRAVHDDEFEPADDYTIDYGDGDKDNRDAEADGAMHNFDAWIEYEMNKYMLDKARRYNYSPAEIKKLKTGVLTFIRHRRSVVDTDPAYLFLVHVAGTTGAHVNTLISNIESEFAYHRTGNEVRLSLEHQTQLNARHRFRTMIKAHGEALVQNISSELLAEQLVSMLGDLEISGVLRYTPQVRQGRDKVLVDLSMKRGGGAVTKGPDLGFMRMIKNTRTRIKLAELVGYQMLLFDQLAPRRAFKTADYARIGAKRDAAWVALMVILGIAGGPRYSGSLKRDRTPDASSFLRAGANFVHEAHW